MPVSERIPIIRIRAKLTRAGVAKGNIFAACSRFIQKTFDNEKRLIVFLVVGNMVIWVHPDQRKNQINHVGIGSTVAKLQH